MPEEERREHVSQTTPSSFRKQGARSWRELPIRYAEFGACHRNEPSSSLHGIMRARAFEEDDAHVFCREQDVERSRVLSAPSWARPTATSVFLTTRWRRRRGQRRAPVTTRHGTGRRRSLAMPHGAAASRIKSTPGQRRLACRHQSQHGCCGEDDSTRSARIRQNHRVGPRKIRGNETTIRHLSRLPGAGKEAYFADTRPLRGGADPPVLWGEMSAYGALFGHQNRTRQRPPLG
jgi:hypothetical protein